MADWPKKREETRAPRDTRVVTCLWIIWTESDDTGALEFKSTGGSTTLAHTRSWEERQDLDTRFPRQAPHAKGGRGRHG